MRAWLPSPTPIGLRLPFERDGRVLPPFVPQHTAYQVEVLDDISLCDALEAWMRTL